MELPRDDPEHGYLGSRSRARVRHYHGVINFLKMLLVHMQENFYYNRFQIVKKNLTNLNLKT